MRAFTQSIVEIARHPLPLLDHRVRVQSVVILTPSARSRILIEKSEVGGIRYVRKHLRGERSCPLPSMS